MVRNEAPRQLVASSIAPESAGHERAPTLLGGGPAGGQGRVRVWHPQRKLVVREYIIATAIIIALLSAQRLIWFLPFPVAVSLKWLIIALLVGLMAGFIPLFRPSWRTLTSRGGWGPASISTDDYGLATNADRNHPALPWSDVVGGYCSTRVAGLLVLYTLSEGPIIMDLNGYPAQEREELWSQIVERAHLTPPEGSVWFWPLSYAWSRPDYTIQTFGRPTPRQASLSAPGGTEGNRVPVIRQTEKL